MIMIATARRFRWIPGFGKSRGTQQGHGARWMHWLGWAFIITTEEYAVMLTELIKQSPDETATVVGAWAKIRTEVAKGVQERTQWLQDSQSEQIARRLDAENRCREVEKKYNELVKSIQEVRRHGLEVSGRMTDHKIHLDDGK